MRLLEQIQLQLFLQALKRLFQLLSPDLLELLVMLLLLEQKGLLGHELLELRGTELELLLDQGVEAGWDLVGRRQAGPAVPAARARAPPVPLRTPFLRRQLFLPGLEDLHQRRRLRGRNKS